MNDKSMPELIQCAFNLVAGTERHLLVPEIELLVKASMDYSFTKQDEDSKLQSISWSFVYEYLSLN